MSDGRAKHWVVALHQELRKIVSEINLDLPRPTIHLHESEQVWGRWDPLNLSISVSRPLVETCPWRVVVEILKHEIAHQITDHQYGHGLQPHGPEFRRVCEMLKIEEWAQSAASGKSLDELRTLADWKSTAPDDETARYRRRLQRLLALAHSSNEHEALLAMQRAQELQDAHRFREGEVRRAELWVSLEIGAGKQRHAPYEGRIASILMSHFHVDIVFASRFDAASCRPEAVIDILGRREDVLLAEHVHGFLHHSVQSLWQAERKRSQAAGLRARNSYIRGLLAGFDRKLADEGKQSKTTRIEIVTHAQSLVVADQKERSLFVRRRYPRLAARRSSARIDSGAYQAGQREGAKLDLRSPVGAGQASSGTRLLPP